MLQFRLPPFQRCPPRCNAKHVERQPNQCKADGTHQPDALIGVSVQEVRGACVEIEHSHAQFIPLVKRYPCAKDGPSIRGYGLHPEDLLPAQDGIHRAIASTLFALPGIKKRRFFIEQRIKDAAALRILFLNRVGQGFQPGREA